MKRPPLVRVTAAIFPEAEDATGVLFETMLERPPATYTDAETGQTSVTCYVEKRVWRDSLRRELQTAIAALRQHGIDPGPGKVSVRSIRHEDWAESWKRHFKPISIAGKLLIKPGWSKRRAARGQAVMILDPGLSFGTGHHATTGFCLEQLVASRKPRTRQALLDIGTGSGILAIAAAKLGYSPVEAFDFDPEAVRVSRRNAELNRVNRAVRPTRRDIRKLPLASRPRFDVVCANLMAGLLIAEAGRIVSRVKPGGHLVLAGILQHQFSEVRRCYEELGLELVQAAVEKEWHSGCFRKLS